MIFQKRKNISKYGGVILIWSTAKKIQIYQQTLLECEKICYLKIRYLKLIQNLPVTKHLQKMPRGFTTRGNGTRIFGCKGSLLYPLQQ